MRNYFNRARYQRELMYPDTHRRTRGNSLILSSAVASLMNRHSQWVYRTLEGILGNQDVAREAMQDTFLKAFQHSLDLRAVRSFRHGL
jgi:DNA-directed RNA polymerase specialized sigma24 family protein